MDSADAISSELISSLTEAREYYRVKLARSHSITCGEATVTVVFEPDGTHLYSVEVEDFNAIPDDQVVTRNVGRGKREVRQFSLDRARLMDQVLPSVSNFIWCISSYGPPSRSPRLLHGPKMACGRYMRVVLSPGPRTAWTCLSAYPIDAGTFDQARRSKPARFP
jgi:hypothetical protein